MNKALMFFDTEEGALAEIATFRGWPLAVTKEINVNDSKAWAIFADDSDDAKSYNKDGYFQ